MHSVLQIPEIRDAIILFATEQEYFVVPDTKVALRLALTSKNFLEPSLDRLWESMNNICRVIERLPQDLRRIEQRFREKDAFDQATGDIVRKQIPYRCLVFVREPTANDWQRFDYYARRIQRLRNDQGRHTSFYMFQNYSSWAKMSDAEKYYPLIDSTALAILARRSQLWLPRIRSLHVNEVGEARLEDLQWAFRPILQHFCLERWSIMFDSRLEHLEYNTVLIRALDLLFRSCPMLVSLKIHPNQVNWPGYGALTRASVLPRLKVFDAYDDSEHELRLDTPPHVIKWLSTQPLLTELNLRLNHLRREHQDVSSAPDSTTPTPHFSFPSLAKLQLHVEDLLDFQMFIQAARMPNIQSLTVEVSHMFSEQRFNDLVKMLSQHVNMSGLENCTIEMHKESDASRYEDGVVGVSCIRALLPAQNLKTLKLRVNLSFDSICKSLLVDMAAAWPNLETLILFGLGDSNSIGFRDVADFAQACPNLRVLGLHFDATEGIDQSNHLRFNETGQWCRLEELYVGLSRVDPELSMHNFMAERFPCLTKLEPEYIRRHGESAASAAERDTFKTWCIIANVWMGYQLSAASKHRLKQLSKADDSSEED